MKSFRTLFFTSLILSAFLLCSCENIFGKSSDLESDGAGSMNATISLKGAFPAEILTLWQQDSSRTAFPGLPTTGISYYAKATATVDGTVKTISGDFASDNKSFTITGLDYGVQWSFEVGINDSTTPTRILLKDTYEMKSTEVLSTENQVFTHDFELKPLKTPEERGEFSLEFEIEPDCGIASIGYDNQFKTSNFSSNKATITVYAHNPGSYEREFTFWSGPLNSSNKCTGTLLFSLTEIINTFSNLTTNTWARNAEDGGSPWLVEYDDAGVTKTKCYITKALIDSYKQNTFYVKQGATAGTGTFLNPLNSISAAVEKMTDKDTDYTIYVMGELIGLQTIPATLKKTGSGGSYTYARSLTLRGYTGLSEGVPQDSINGGRTETANGTTLKILTEVPVIIKDIKITGGYAAQSSAGGGGIYSKGDLTLESGALINGNHTLSCGGGIYNDGGTLRIKSGAVISENTEVSPVSGCGGGGIFNYNGIIIMSGGTIKANTANHNGGGIYSEIDDGDKLCAIYIYGDAVIGGDTAADGNKALGTSSDGGGIYNKGGLIYFGCTGYLATGNQMEDVTYYDPDPAKIIPWTGKLSHNTTGGWGGGIINYPSTLDINTYGHKVTGIIHVQSGKISSNSATMGGGIAHHNGTLFYIHGGTIGGDSASEGNSATNKGGGIYTMGKFFLKGGTVSYNTADLGGGVCGDNGLLMYGGTIKNNTATTHGGGVFVDYRSLQIRGSAYIPAGSDGKNDVYLNKRDTESDPAVVYLHDPVTPPAECTDGIVALITPNEYIDNKEIITIASSETATTTIENEYKKFFITPQVSGGVTTCWGINKTDGKLKKLIGKKNRPDAKYDIVFNDGSATAYSSSLSLSDDEKAAAIAVIFYVGTECSNDNTTYRKLGVGLKQGTDKYWCLGEENMVGCPSIRCQPGGSAGNWGWAADADKNGSDNLQQFAENLLTRGKSDTTSNSSAYPAFYFSINYASVSGSNVSGSDYETGWYLPSACELSRIYLETKETATTVNTLNTIMDKCAGTTFYTSGAHIYGTSSTDNDDYYCGYVGFNTNNYTFKDDDDWDFFQRNYVKCIALAIHEF